MNAAQPTPRIDTLCLRAAAAGCVVLYEPSAAKPRGYPNATEPRFLLVNTTVDGIAPNGKR